MTEDTSIILAPPQNEPNIMVRKPGFTAMILFGLGAFFLTAHLAFLLRGMDGYAPSIAALSAMIVAYFNGRVLAKRTTAKSAAIAGMYIISISYAVFAVTMMLLFATPGAWLYGLLYMAYGYLVCSVPILGLGAVTGALHFGLRSLPDRKRRKYRVLGCGGNHVPLLPGEVPPS